MSEMMEDAIDTLDEDEEELEEEAEAEVQNVLFSITDGKLGQMGSVGGKLPQVCPASSLITFKAAFSPVDFSPITTGYRVLSSCRRGRPGRHRKNASTTEWPPPELEVLALHFHNSFSWLTLRMSRFSLFLFYID